MKGSGTGSEGRVPARRARMRALLVLAWMGGWVAAACGDIETAPRPQPVDSSSGESDFSWLATEVDEASVEPEGPSASLPGDPEDALATDSGEEAGTSSEGTRSSGTPTAVPEEEELPEGLALDGFAFEAYAIGDRWYDYDGRTHVLTPRDEIYRVAYQDAVAFLAIDSYYGADGNSGWFTLKWRVLEGGSLGPTQVMELSRNVKEREVCVSIAPLEEVTCRNRRAALRFRTDARVVPAAGFSVTNPAIYEAQPPGEGAAGIVRLRGVSLDTIPEAALGERGLRPRPSVAAGYEASILGRRHLGVREVEGRPTFVQASAAMRLVQWRVYDAETREDAEVLAFEVRCVALASRPEAQTSLEEAPIQRAELWMERGEDRASLLRLCGETGPEVVEEREGRYAADWPDTRTFDLIAEQVEGRLWLRAASGALLWNAGAAAGDAFEAVVVPDVLWD